MKGNRREFIKKGGELAALSIVRSSSDKADMFGMAGSKNILSEAGLKSPPVKPIMKIAYQASSEPGENDIKFIQQMGIGYVVLGSNAQTSSYEYYNSRRLLYEAAGISALEIADSPNIGICLCVGCWLDGGTLMGKDVIETIKYFGKKNKILKVHLQNVNQPLPHFKETFLDDGYADMYKILKALKEVDFDGVFIADHIPAMVGGSQTGSAFSIGYMKGLPERVIAEG